MSPSAAQAAAFQGSGVIELRPAPVTTRPPGLARVTVDLCALCGSDKRLLASGADVTPGHEIVGTVAELPDQELPDGQEPPDGQAPLGEAPPPERSPTQAEGIRVGQRVLVYIPVYCGRCAACRAGQTNRCRELDGLVGWQLPGGFQGFVDVPARNLIPVPADIGPLTALLALDTIGTAAHGLRMCAQALGELPAAAAVVGCGALGLGAIATLGALGVAGRWAADPAPARAEAAAGLGARLLGGPDTPRTFPLVVEASGSPAARALALNLISPGGAVLLLGEGSEPLTMPATPGWRRKDAFYIRSFYFPLSEVAGNFELLRSLGTGLAARLCTLHPLAELPAVFERFCAGELIKPVIDVSGHADALGQEGPR